MKKKTSEIRRQAKKDRAREHKSWNGHQPVHWPQPRRWERKVV